MPNPSNPVTVRVVAPTVPAWYSALAHKQWYAPINNPTAISQNRHWIGASAVLDPHSPASIGSSTGIIQGFNGIGVDAQRSTIFTLGNGGHNNYDGNEVYSCDLSAANPVWTRRRNATVVSGLSTGQDYSVWPQDGRPTSNHTMSMTTGAEGRWILPGLASRNYQGTADYFRWFEFSPTTNDWIDLGSNHRGGAWEVVFGTACFDPVDRHIITVTGPPTAAPNHGVHFTHMTALNGLPQFTNPANMNWTGYTNCMIDTTNRVVVVRGGGFYSQQGEFYRIYRIGTPALKVAAPQAYNQGSQVTGTPGDFQSSLEWHAPSAAFLTKNPVSGPNMIKLTPTVVGGVYTGMVWSQVTTGWNTSLANPIWEQSLEIGGGGEGKFHLMPMADGSTMAIWWSRWAAPDVYVCRLTGAI